MGFPALSRTFENRAKKEFDVTKLDFSIYNNGRLKRVSVIKAELTNVPNQSYTMNTILPYRDCRNSEYSRTKIKSLPKTPEIRNDQSSPNLEKTVQVQ